MVVYNLETGERSFVGVSMSLPDAKVIELYSDGESCASIARLGKCSETTIYTRLKTTLGVEMRSRSEANQIFPDFIFVCLYNMGLSASQVGRLLGVDSTTVIKRLHKIRFPLRSRNLARQIRYTEDEFLQHFMVHDVLGTISQLTYGQCLKN